MREPGVAKKKKTDRERKLKRTRSATAERAAGAASRELRITCVAFGIRNHPCGWIAERHGAYRPALPAFGAVEEPEDLPFYRLPFCRVVRARLPLPYREGEPESPPSNYREATPFSGKGLFFRGQPDQERCSLGSAGPVIVIWGDSSDQERCSLGSFVAASLLGVVVARPQTVH
ncbi:hypothetical protein MTP99_014039 [Tenebrio molitor]|nr:hypothetical protein MTP99_014039 [Tenebrio molitor]